MQPFLASSLFLLLRRPAMIALLAVLGSSLHGESAEDASLVRAALFSRATEFNGRAYFAADNGISGTELWVSDGTAAGTFLLRDLNPGSGSSNPDYFTVASGRLYFSTFHSNGGALWVSDGTIAGTVQLKNFTGSTLFAPRALTAAGGKLYFTAGDSATGTEPWSSDGTAAGTRMVADVNPGSARSDPWYFADVNGTVYFSAESSTTTGKGKRKVTTSTGIELWKTNGTAAGTSLVKDLVPGSSHSLPRELISFNGLLYFTATTPTTGQELFRSNGTSAGTVLVKDFVAGSSSSSPRALRTHAGKLYLNAFGASLSGLWQSDGTTAGTMPASIAAGVPGFVSADFVALGSRIVVQSENANGRELWSSDGVTGTFLHVMNPADGFPEAFLGGVKFGTRYLFTALTHEIGFDLYTTDGTAAGTSLVFDFQPVNEPVPEPLFLAVLPTQVLLSAPAGLSGHELWRTDGTNAGTTIVTDLQPD